jgi:nucleotide-binding universal stress UspA family protein
MTQTYDQKRHDPTSPPWAEPGRAVVVGVDGSKHSLAAAAWAATEAAASHRPLTLLHVLNERRVPSPLHGLETDDQHGWRILARVEHDLKALAPGIELSKEMAVGAVDACLVSRSAAQSALVVGRRGLGSFTRLLVGSSSVSVASHARVPVVVVPEGWPVKEHQTEPVTVGVDHHDVQAEALLFAFTEAQRRGVPLIVAHGREMPDPGADLPTDAPAPVNETEQASVEALERAVQPFQALHPDVKVSFVHRNEHPLTVLLDVAGPAQLGVLGRPRDRRRGGFPFGSVARGVLHYAEVPVAIVPPTH